MDPSQDTRLARLLHLRGRLPLATLLSLLEEARRSQGRETLAQLLTQRQHLPLEEARTWLSELAPAAAAPAKRPWSVGDEVAGLRIEAKLGEGGMGTVYRALDLATGAAVAVKTLAPAANPEERVRFEREAQAQAAVDGHPNVIRIHRAGIAGERAYLVMELALGGDLSARIAQAPLPPREAATLVRDLAQGLSHVHAQGVLHRDLKPGNVVFDERGTPKLADFGLARAEGAETLTQTGTVLGTPSHMAPEQVDAKPGAIGERADVYGLGALLYHCLTQSPPFSSGSLYEVLLAVLETRPTPPSERNPRVPQALEEICLRALEKDPGLRQESAAALAAELDAFLAGEIEGSRRGAPLALWAVPSLALVGLALALGVARLNSGFASPLPSVTASTLPSATLRAQALHEEARAALVAYQTESALAAIDSAIALSDPRAPLGHDLAQLRSQTLLLLGQFDTLPGALPPGDLPFLEIAKVRAEIEAAAATRVEVFGWDGLQERASALARDALSVLGETPWLRQALRRQVGETLFALIFQCPKGVGPRTAVEGWFREQLPRLLGQDDPRIPIARGLFIKSRADAFSGKLPKPGSLPSPAGLEPRWQANLAVLRILISSKAEEGSRYAELARRGPPLFPGEEFAKSPVEISARLDVARRVASQAERSAFGPLRLGEAIDPEAFKIALALRARAVDLTRGPLFDRVLALELRVKHEELLACSGDPSIARRPLPQRARTRVLNRARLVRIESALDQGDAPAARALLELIHDSKLLDYETLFARLEALEGDTAAAEARLTRAEGLPLIPALATRSIRTTREILAGRDPRVALREALAR